MPTTNATINHDWGKIADAADETVLVTFNSMSSVEFATTAEDSAPEDLAGHLLTYPDAITRSVIGPGYIWARVRSRFSDESEVTLTVTR